MKKRFFKQSVLFLTIFLLGYNVFSNSIIKPYIQENNISVKNIDYLKASVFVKLSAKEFIAITGKKLNFPQKVYFKIVQKRLKHELKKNPELLISEYYDETKEKFKFDFLWLVV